jgi:predicted N-acetyltransferase YhbS
MTIRTARLEDAPKLAELSGELGYPSSVAEIRARLPLLLSSQDHLVLVAVDPADMPVGWLHAAIRRELESDAFVQIAGLVVGTSHRSAGLGSALLFQAEEWARQAGVHLVRVRSNVTRNHAHGFYVRAGYALVKTSHLFVKELG